MHRLAQLYLAQASTVIACTGNFIMSLQWWTLGYDANVDSGLASTGGLWVRLHRLAQLYLEQVSTMIACTGWHSDRFHRLAQ